MAARSSTSSDYASNSTDETLVALDSSDYGSSDVIRVGVKRKTSETESSSLMGQINNSQNAKGKAIINGAADFHERSGGEVVTPKNLGAESSHLTDINNLQVKLRNHGSLSDTQGVEKDEVVSAFIECGCCYDEFLFENMVHCSNGHPFCFQCLSRRVVQIIYGGLRANPTLWCMDIDECDESIPLSEIRRALPNDVIEKYEYRQAQEAIAEAKLEGLVYCPFCNIPCIVDDKCIEVLDCPNTKCLKSSCIQCKKPSHIPLQCEEVEKMCDTNLRTTVEERMSKAVIRECNICNVELVKMNGCNKIRCNCGNIMCYICRKTVEKFSNHFCTCYLYTRVEPGKTFCKICNKCSLMENEKEDNEALAAKEEALEELVEKEPKLLDLEIGPPLKKLRRQTPTQEEGPDTQRRSPQRFPPPESEQQENHMPRPPQNWPLQRFPTYGIVTPPNVFGFGDPFGPMPPPQFAIRDDQPADMAVPFLNMVVPPPLPLQEELFRFGGQFANRVERPAPLPPPHFFRFGDGDQLENMALTPPLAPDVDFGIFGEQLANMDVPPLLPQPDFFRFSDGDLLENMAFTRPLAPQVDFPRFGEQLTNMDVPPPLPRPHFFRFGDGGQLENMALTPPLAPEVDLGVFGEQLANMNVPPLLPQPHFFRFGDSDQLANMDVPPPLPQPHFFRFGDGDLFRFGDGDQLANMDVPPPLPQPHFFRFGDGYQLENMALTPPLPSPLFFRFGYGYQLENMALTPPLPPPLFFRFGYGDQPASMQLQDQEDYGH